MKITTGGKEHKVGDLQCPSCRGPSGENWPQLHRDIATTCLGLVHAEVVPAGVACEGSEIIYYCDVCGRDPI